VTIGAEPESAWMTGIDMDERGFVRTQTREHALPFQTSALRVFAVGDLRAGSIKRTDRRALEGLPVPGFLRSQAREVVMPGR
jgi:thioredoxin reductase